MGRHRVCVCLLCVYLEVLLGGNRKAERGKKSKQHEMALHANWYFVTTPNQHVHVYSVLALFSAYVCLPRASVLSIVMQWNPPFMENVVVGCEVNTMGLVTRCGPSQTAE